MFSKDYTDLRNYMPEICHSTKKPISVSQTKLMYQELDQKRLKVIEELKIALEKPFVGKIKVKQISKTIRNDPIRKIMLTNDKINKTNVLMNKKLL